MMRNSMPTQQASAPTSTKVVPQKLIADPIVEKEIRRQLKKPEDELTNVDLEKVTWVNLNFKKLTEVKDLEKLTELETLHLAFNQLTDVKGLEKLTQLTFLNLNDNTDLTKAQIDELNKALPKCKISSNAKK